jgi:hypothetical protein
MAASQPVAGVKIEAGGGEEAEADRYKDDIDHANLP